MKRVLAHKVIFKGKTHPLSLVTFDSSGIPVSVEPFQSETESTVFYSGTLNLDTMTPSSSFLDLAAARHSVRGYTSQPVSDEDLDYIIRCARLAPSAVNRQPWHLLVVRDPLTASRLVKAYPGRDWFAAAPVHIVVCVDDSAAWVRPFDNHSHADIDAAIIAEHICLAAADRSLGTCWVCNFDPAVLSAELSLSDNRRPVVVIPLGHPAPDSTRPTVRRDISEIVSYI